MSLIYTNQIDKNQLRYILLLLLWVFRAAASLKHQLNRLT